ncbi:hypothetical protein JMUB3933_0569 [Leptotrichia wadei]|uniref:Autotransporter domain-containing protein n=1 Tax=Leptotrichia wadei TaxID=157687 RepID=A0A510K664_9FUSO|nr:autotransporter-associated N-terminal domain-containing protein [Leptotrichia wadei]BBM47069.1 hypothetical protein JMUB3933_0569 [Leptotrichia wadei]
MSNNLRQIARDLRSFVKRCKDVHYSDSLLISFLITGLLTIAPKLHADVADVASEQQEVTAQTYDAITDLRQSFMRARKENEKSLKGAQSELVQLLRQGDQVIKSPWSSFQFGTGYMNNDWGTTYRGRGGKFLEYYKRDNDLTKYVFDPTKHLYGATNLNIPRNQEPDALTINPANVYKAYEPTEVTKMDAMTLPNAPAFRPQALTPNSGYYKPYEFSTTRPTRTPANPTTTNLQYTSYDGRNRNDANDRSDLTYGTGVIRTGGVAGENGWESNNNSNKVHSDAAASAGTVQDITVSGITSLSNGDLYVGTNLQETRRQYDLAGNTDPNDPNGTSRPLNRAIRGSWWGREGMFSTPGTNDSLHYWNESEAEYRNVIINGQQLSYGLNINHDYGVGGFANTYGEGNVAVNGSAAQYQSLLYSNSNLDVSGVKFEIGSSTKGSMDASSGIASESANGTDNRVGWFIDGGTSNNLKYAGRKRFNVWQPANIPAFGTNFEVYDTPDLAKVYVYGSYNVGVYLKQGTFTSDSYEYRVSLDGSSDNSWNNGFVNKGGTATFQNTIGVGTGIWYRYYTDNNGVAHRDPVPFNLDTNSNFYVGGSNSNGILTKGGSTIVGHTGFTVSGTSDNGINVIGGNLDVDDSSFNITGSYNNGINAQSGAGTVDVDSSSFAVGGNYNNGMVFSDGGNSGDMDDITATVTGTNSNGILFYNGDGGSDNHTVKLKNFIGSVSGGNHSSIINMHNLKALEFTTTNDSRDTSFTVSGSSIGIDINNGGLEVKELTFGTTDNNKVVEMTLSGDKNVGFNIGGGQTNNSESTRQVSIGKVSNTNGLDIAVMGNENVVYNNVGYANKLTIDNGNATMATTPLAGNGRIIIGNWNNGNVLGYNKNIIFANQGYVQGTTNHDSSVKLNHIEVAGDENTIAYFAKGNGGYMSNNWLSTNNPAVGFFDGNVELQGVIGKYELHNNNGATPSDKISENNVGVYASSGQRDTLKTDIIGQSTPVTLKDLNITNLNIGVGPHAKYTTLVYADNGTVVDVANTNSSVLGVANTISDGQLLDTTNKWGYGVAYDALSDYTTIGYAKGIFDSNANNFLNNMTHALDTLPSEVKFLSPVDMVSKHGVAYHADAGGKISAKATRAGGMQSIIGLAEGSNGTPNATTYKNMIVGGDTTESGSIVVVEGNIVAADNSLFSTDSMVSRGRITTDKQFAYDNAAGVAKNGGKVIFKKATAATSTIEAAPTSAPSSSLIFGLGGYAEGDGSQVIYTSKTLDNTNKAAALIVSGAKGALYATNNGYVEFNGDIIHKNNAGTGKSTGKNTDGAAITNANENVGGTGLAGNDHKNLPIFYVNRINASDTAGITFNDDTRIDLYDGILLTGDQYYHGQTRYWSSAIGNDYNGHYSDYYKEANKATNDATAWEKAKYRGMKNVKVYLVNSADGEINLGLVNQASKEIEWDSNQDKTAGNFLKGIGEFAGGMSIHNDSQANAKSTSKAMGVNSSIINGKFKISTNVDLSDNVTKNNKALFVTAPTPPALDNTISNDPFNNIKMESEYVTIASGALVAGDGTNLAGQGLSMANSLFRWDKDNVTYRRSKNTESGYENSGTVNIWGGSDTDAVTGINVAYGTIENKDSGKVYVDHGNALVGTDGSILTNKGKIVVTGLYNPATQTGSAYASGIINAPTAVTGRSVETAPKGENYGIVGISTKDVLDHNSYNRDRYGENKVNITNIADGANGTIEVAGEMAVGIYAKNVNQKNYIQNVNNSQFAKSNDVTIEYDNQSAANADAIRLNYGTNGTSNTAMQQNKALRGVGIALVEEDKDTTDTNRGGIINLNTKNNGIGQTADILTFENGIGVYGESAKINFKGDSTGLTVDTGSDGAGIWVTDDSTISSKADRLGTPKALNYNYKGYNDKKGFGMIFGSTDPNNKYGGTTAKNYLDIKFNNNGDTNLTLTVEKAQTSPGTITAGKGTTRGIAGMLVNTDANDSVYNYGDIKEDTSKTNVRAYGAVVNKGRLVNHGNIELNDSLNVDASSVEKDDLKKVNVGIMANDHTTAANTWIENYGDIKVGTTSRKNIGGFGIYGYNIITGEKSDHTPSTITVNSNSYGIYSGDGTVKVQKGTKLLVGNDTVLGHVQTTTGKAITTNPSAYPISRQTAYSQASELLSGRKTDAAYGVYIGDNTLLSGGNRNVEVSADMDIDRFSYGIVLAKNAGAEAGGTNGTTVKIGDGNYTLDAKGKVSSLTPTIAPTIVLAANKNAGGLVKSTAPSTPKVPEEVDEQGNAVYYYSADKNSKASSFANVTMNGDYNTAYYTAGSVDNFGTIDLRSQNNLLTVNGSSSANLGYGNLGIVSTNPNVASTNYGTIITSMSDTLNQKYSAGMAAGRNVYNDEGKFVRFEDEGYVVNRGTITVSQDEGIGMFATGTRSKAINYGTIDLQGKKAIGMYLDRGAQGENYGTITGDAEGVKGVVALNNGYIKNYGTIRVTGTGSVGIITDNINVKTDNEDPSKYNGGTEKGKAAAIKYVASGDEKTTGVGTTITVPDTVPLTKITVDGVDTPIFDVESDAAAVGDWAKNITVSSSIQTGGTRIIDLSVKNEWGNPVWEHAYKNPLSEVTSIGMYVDTSGVRYTNPIDGIQNLPHLSEVNLYFGPEATLYTNSKAIRIGDKVDVNGNVTKSNILKPFNDALSNLPGGAIINPLSASLTWQVKAKLDANNQLSEVYMSKVPYHSFAYDNDKSLVNFTNNLDNIYEIARQESAEKVIFNKLNSLGNGEGHILAQAFDQMRGHIYGGVQQRIKSTSDILGGEISSLRSERNVSKDSNKFKAFGQRNEFKTDTAGMPDWYSNAGGFAFVHEDETVRLGQSSGWSAGVVNNYFTFKDLSKSYENQAMAKVGVFKSIPLDANGTFILSLGGDGFFGRNDMKRRFWVVDQQFRAKASYYSYGAGLNAGLEKSFVVNDGFSIVPNLGIRAEYGRFSSIHEKGDMALNVKSDDYVSVKPSVGIDFRYNQEVFKNSNLTASLGFAYENEIGKLYDVENEARIVGAWTDYFGIRGDKEDKRGNFKSDLKLGLDNGRFGFNVNTGYDSKGHNFRAGMGLKVLY